MARRVPFAARASPRRCGTQLHSAEYRSIVRYPAVSGRWSERRAPVKVVKESEVEQWCSLVPLARFCVAAGYARGLWASKCLMSFLRLLQVLGSGLTCMRQVAFIGRSAKGESSNSGRRSRSTHHRNHTWNDTFTTTPPHCGHGTPAMEPRPWTTLLHE